MAASKQEPQTSKTEHGNTIQEKQQSPAMASKQFNTSKEEIFRFFDEKPGTGFGFLDFPEKPLPPRPPCLEVLASEVSPTKHTLEPVNVGGITLVKGKVSTQDVFGLANSDLEPGKYEGGLKLWEGSLDLIAALSSEIQEGKLSFTGKRVLELGCGHGLPGILACLKGSAAVHFQDFNAEVLRSLTIPNVIGNIARNCEHSSPSEEGAHIDVETRFFSGDWSDMDSILLPVSSNGCEVGCSQLDQGVYYDIILMAETVYSISSVPNLYKLIKKCLHNSGGVVYMAAKKYYFGVGGGSRHFLSVVEKDGAFASSLITEVADGSSNVREVWKLQRK